MKNRQSYPVDLGFLNIHWIGSFLYTQFFICKDKNKQNKTKQQWSLNQCFVSSLVWVTKKLPRNRMASSQLTQRRRQYSRETDGVIPVSTHTRREYSLLLRYNNHNTGSWYQKWTPKASGWAVTLTDSLSSPTVHPRRHHNFNGQAKCSRLPPACRRSGW